MTAFSLFIRTVKYMGQIVRLQIFKLRLICNYYCKTRVQLKNMANFITNAYPDHQSI